MAIKFSFEMHKAGGRVGESSEREKEIEREKERKEGEVGDRER